MNMESGGGGDATGTLSQDIELDEEEEEHVEDVSSRVQQTLSDINPNSTRSSFSYTLSEDGNNSKDNTYSMWSYGFQTKASYDHNKKHTDIMGVTYNGRMCSFIIVDGKGITTWNKDAVSQQVHRACNYPKYEHRLIIQLIYVRKYNVYFALGKDFSLQVLNREFEETCSVSSNMRSVLFMLFNPVRDELITGGVGGTKVWRYHQDTKKSWATEIRSMSNYKLSLKYELANVGGSWVKKVELDIELQHLYCCSDTDLIAYDMDGNKIFSFERAHNMSITGCAYSQRAQLLVTCSADSEVKVWSLAGGSVKTFRGHAKAVTNLILHPENSSLVITSSMDGTVRLWSLDIMDCIYTVQVSANGVQWMGLTDDKLLYTVTTRNVTVWNISAVTQFWAVSRSKVNVMRLQKGEGKSSRLTAQCEDGSFRIFSRRMKKNLSTVLPPHNISPMQQIRGATYNRTMNVAYLLVDNKNIWVYTTRTDPACRINAWNMAEIQNNLLSEHKHRGVHDADSSQPGTDMFNKVLTSHRTSASGLGSEAVCDVQSICHLGSPAMMWTDEGMCCPIQTNYLLVGLEDGRILFMDPVHKGKRHMEFKAGKDPVLSIMHDTVYNCLITLTINSTDGGCYHIWSLPALDSLYEVNCHPDVVGFARLGSTAITSTAAGMVFLQPLLPAEQKGHAAYRRHKFTLTSDADENYGKKRDHNSAIISIDSCPTLGLFLTSSADGSVKIWDENKTLISEFLLDDSLSAACFLGDSGDVVISFKNHIFYIDRRKVYPGFDTSSIEEDDVLSQVGSEIYEDPAVMYEGVAENPEPLSIDTYLVPFDKDFTLGFVLKDQGRQTEAEAEEELEESGDDSESYLSAAPTQTYLSPWETPRNGSTIDLTLTREVTEDDLKSRMNKKLDAEQARKESGKKSIKFEDEEVDAEIQALTNRIDFPKFGTSPGPSPSPTPPSTPSYFSVSEGGESSPEPFDRGLETDRMSTPGDQQTVLEKKKLDTASPGVSPLLVTEKAPFIKRSAMIRIDPNEVLKEEQRKPPPSALTRKQPEMDSKPSSARKAEGRKVVKKEATAVRRRPRRNLKKTSAGPSGDKTKTTGVSSTAKQLVKPAVVQIPQPAVSETTGVIRASTKPSTNDEFPKEMFSDDLIPKGDVTGEEYGKWSRKKRPIVALPGGGLSEEAESSDEDEENMFSDFGKVIVRARRASIADAQEEGSPIPEPMITTGRSSSAIELPSMEELEELGIDLETYKILFLYQNLEMTQQAARRNGLERTCMKDLMDEMNDEARSAQQTPALGVDGSGRPMSSLSTEDGRTTSQSLFLLPEAGEEDYSQSDASHLQVHMNGSRPGTALTASGVLLDGRSTSLSMRTPDIPPGTGFSEAVIGAMQDRLNSDDVHSPATPMMRDLQTPRGLTPGMYSDVGSEWTLPGLTLEELDEIRQANSMTPGGEWRHTLTSGGDPISRSSTRAWYEVKSRRSRSRPHTSYTMKRVHPNTPNTDFPEKPRVRVRPHTAGTASLPIEVLQFHFDKALKQYKGTPGTTDFIESLHKNEGTHFEENWQDRAIKRHLLLKLQRTLRGKSAHERRSTAEQDQKNRQQGLNHHETCSRPGGRGSLSDTSLQTRQSTSSSKTRQEAWSEALVRQGSASQGTRSAQGTRSTQSARSALGARSREALCPSTAPATVRLAGGTQRPRTSMTRTTQTANRPSSQTDAGQRRPHTAASRLMATPVPSRTQSRTKLERQELSAELPFRGRINPNYVAPPPKPVEKPPEIDLSLMDPRNPEAQKHRTHGGRSIPNKCRYILVKHPKLPGEEKIEITPLEEGLIAERFPQFIDQWVGDQRRQGAVVPRQHTPVYLKHSVPPV